MAASSASGTATDAAAAAWNAGREDGTAAVTTETKAPEVPAGPSSAESEASTEVGKCSEPALSDKASSQDGGDSPRGGQVGKKEPQQQTPQRPRWSDLSDGLLGAVALDEELLNVPSGYSQDGSPVSVSSPTKSSRRATRRRRRREEAKEAEEQARACGNYQAGMQGSVTPGMLPKGGMVRPGTEALRVGTCSPTIVSSPARASPMLPICRAGTGNVIISDSPACSPSRGYGPKAPTGIMGDASTRTPTGASPYMCGMTMGIGTDASSRTPTAGARIGGSPAGTWLVPAVDAQWGSLGSPSAQAHGMMSTSPVATSHMVASPMATYGTALSPMAGPSTAADALRALLGPSGMPANQRDLVMQLRAAAPETYED